ncbi:uncharacterized protein LOC126734610 isoform X2 [Anthonomus grandis grandis]|uniref:uncharacterized protein LOC126734610 isoform X2 n=1 Tax=Anthonomus grandis grandis TaxID=2921223 RepID=UPI0021658275|nr:uncharacterized protein LOC126734610 isoform X2 [Anthonomus grandis grandis]
MESSSLMQRSSKLPNQKLKSFRLNVKNHPSRSKNSVTKNSNIHHNHQHHSLGSHFRNRHISRARSSKKYSKVNGNGFKDSARNNSYIDKTDGQVTSLFGYDNTEHEKNQNDLAISKEDVLVGNFTREVYNAICLRLGDTLHIPEDSVKALFNDMHLFPSDTQVTKMLQCARQYSRRNGTNPNYLTFGEFCVFVREMQNHPSPKVHRKTSQPKINNNKCPNNKCEVFLGGSCNPTTWRADTAIPALQKQGISYYNPQVSMWAPELVAQEHDAKQAASVLLFVIDSQTRSTVGMVEVAYLVACGRCVIVVAQPYRKEQSIMGEVITEKEYYNLVQGQRALLDLIKTKGVQIHNSLPTALQCTADIVKNIFVNGTTAEEQVTAKLRRLREVYDSYNGSMGIYDVIDAYRRLTNRSLEISKLYNFFNQQNSTNATVMTNGEENGAFLSFERFCAVMAELSTDGCGMCNIEAWATQTFTTNEHPQCPTSPNHPNCSADQLQFSSPPSTNSEPLYDVFLGGSLLTGTKWRENIAIPLLKKNGIRYYNPVLRDENSGSTEDVSKWRQKISQCRVALFVITNDTRSLASMILAAHYIGIGKDVVLSIEQLNGDDCVVSNETLTKTAIKDYNRARAYLRDLAERRQVPVLDNVEDAIRTLVPKLSKN